MSPRVDEPRSIPIFIAAAADVVKACAEGACRLPWSTLATPRIAGFPVYGLAVQQARVKLAVDITYSAEHSALFGLFRSSQQDTVARIRAETSLRPATSAERGIAPGRLRRMLVLPEYLRLDITHDQVRTLCGAPSNAPFAVVLDLAGAGFLGVSRDSDQGFRFRCFNANGTKLQDSMDDDDEVWFPIATVLGLLERLQADAFAGWQVDLAALETESSEDGVGTMRWIGQAIEQIGLDVATDLHDALGEPGVVSPADLSGYLVGDLQARLEFALDEQGRLATLARNEDRISFGTNLRLARNGPDEILARYTVGAPDVLAQGRVFDAFVDEIGRASCRERV